MLYTDNTSTTNSGTEAEFVARDILADMVRISDLGVDAQRVEWLRWSMQLAEALRR